VTGQLGVFGPELRRRRVAAGLSLSDVAKMVHYSKSYLSKIENGVKPPSAELARVCDVALRAGGDLAALVRSSGRQAEVPGERNAEGGLDTWEMRLALDGSSRFMPLNRRDLIVAGASTLLGVGAGVPALSAAAREDLTVATLWSQFAESRRVAQLVSPSVVLPALIAQTHVLRQLAGAAGEPGRSRLLVLCARYAEYTGWMVQELGDARAADWWTGLAVEMAAAAGETDLAAYALVRRALAALYRFDAVATVDLAVQAQSYRRVPVRIRGLAAQREAQGHALAGSYGDCKRALDRAAVLLGQPGSDNSEAPALGPSTLADPVVMITGWCLLDLGRPGESASVLGPEVGRLPTAARRARARYGTRLARAFAAAGEVDHSCSLAEAVLDDVEVVDSATVRVDVRRLAHTLARWHNHGPVRDLSPRLAAALQTSNI
jgi:transcriptional regulator with XRE-family HTH domain